MPPSNQLYLHCEGGTGSFISSLIFKKASVNLTLGAQNHNKKKTPYLESPMSQGLLHEGLRNCGVF
jgi:hypothetical protein